MSRSRTITFLAATLPPPGETILPTMAELYQDLGRPLQHASLATFTATYRIALEGTVTTQSGVTAQRMVESLVREEGPPAARHTRETALLRLLARSRPELRAALPPHAMLAVDGFDRVASPLMLGGYAFAYEDSGYFGYGDITADHSWIYLADSAEVGTTFELQLMPQLVDDVWLYGLVRSHRAFTVQGRRHCNAVEVQYVVDLGESVSVDEAGQPVGAYRSYVSGIIVYVPEIGPVYCHERLHAQLRTAYDPEANLTLHADQILVLMGRD